MKQTIEKSSTLDERKQPEQNSKESSRGNYDMSQIKPEDRAAVKIALNTPDAPDKNHKTETAKDHTNNKGTEKSESRSDEKSESKSAEKSSEREMER